MERYYYCLPVKLDLVFEHENWPKRDLVAGPFQLIGRVPKKCSKSRLVKNSSGFLPENYPMDIQVIGRLSLTNS